MLSGSPPGSVGGGSVDYPHMQQMLTAMMGMMNAEKEKEKDKGEREKGVRGRVISDEKKVPEDGRF